MYELTKDERDRRAARKRIKQRRRHHSRRGTDMSTPRGVSLGKKIEARRQRREWLNYIPGRPGQPDREFGSKGLGGKREPSESDLDIERKMKLAVELKNAEMAGKMLGRRLVRQVMTGEGTQHGPEDGDRVDGTG
jgi:hypothetical protein